MTRLTRRRERDAFLAATGLMLAARGRSCRSPSGGCYFEGLCEGCLPDLIQVPDNSMGDANELVS